MIFGTRFCRRVGVPVMPLSRDTTTRLVLGWQEPNKAIPIDGIQVISFFGRVLGGSYYKHVSVKVGSKPRFRIKRVIVYILAPSSIHYTRALQASLIDYSSKSSPLVSLTYRMASNRNSYFDDKLLRDVCLSLCCSCDCIQAGDE